MNAFVDVKMSFVLYPPLTLSKNLHSLSLKLPTKPNQGAPLWRTDHSAPSLQVRVRSPEHLPTGPKEATLAKQPINKGEEKQRAGCARCVPGRPRPTAQPIEVGGRGRCEVETPPAGRESILTMIPAYLIDFICRYS